MGENNFMMYFGYAICALIDFASLWAFVSAIIKRKPIDILMCLGFIFFNAFMTSSIIFGGSAYNNAKESYELYEEGCYYLMSHGNYTEVSRSVFEYMRVIEVVGFVSFGISFICVLVKNKVETGRFFARR